MISSKRAVIALSTFLAVLASACAPAFAGVSAGGGFFTESGNGSSSSGAGLFLSTGAGVPVLPAEVDLTGFVPLATRGGYAVTLEGRFTLPGTGTALGAGYGIGQFGAGHSSGTFTAFLDSRIAPLTSIELRGYFPSAAQASTAGFLGLRFSL
jgi:hypothetical protein